MPKKVYNNVEDHKLLDGKNVVEDITQVGLPTIKHPTTTISAAGMVADIDMPDVARFEAMEYSISHNNGVNGKLLAVPGKHTHEFRIARQVYNAEKGEVEFKSVKCRMTGIHKESNKGDIERGNPYGTTDTYSCLRYEELIDNKQVMLIDAMSGVVKFNTKNYASAVSSLLK